MKEEIISYINSIRLKSDGYVFLLDYKGNMLAHYDPKKNWKKNFLNTKDKNGFEFIKEMLFVINNDKEGFVSYFYSKLDNEQSQKTSFIKGFDTWQWIIGTGYHHKDLDELITMETRKLENKYKREFKLIILISAVSTIILLIVSIFISKLLEKKDL